MNIKILCQLFIQYLQLEKNSSQYTLNSYKKIIEQFLVFMEQQSIISFSSVTYSDVRLYLTTLHDKQLSRRTVSKHISCLRSFYRFLMRENEVKENPFVLASLPKKDNMIPRFLYKEELEKLFEISDLNTELGQRNQALLELLYATGIRVSECCSLKLKDIDFQIGTILVTGKGNKQRYIPFGSYAEKALHTYIEDGRNRLLVANKQINDDLFLNHRGTKLTARGVRGILEKMIKDTSLTNKIYPHMIRHTFATHMLDSGADIRSVQELLGHENLSSTQIYTHVTKERLQKVYNLHHPRA
ncbi:tyrosine recombinase XerC [Gottfriedia luciferensis]|uniref:tyrosine recombinase XerC n=1 Tax=Gottfriedia luciferensis TaxID=178774 RepID=UPI000B44A075|nr:tyrosine recombinase XerC [Gottfriedia luciferensis]